MKRVALLLTIFSIIILTSYLFFKTPEVERHLNPYSIPEERVSFSDLIPFYIPIAESVLAENYSLALEKLSDHKFVYVPRDLRFSFEKFNETLSDVFLRLNFTKERIEEAKNYLAYGEFEKASDSIRSAKIELFKIRKIVEVTVGDLEKRIAIPLPREVVNRILERYEKEIEALEKPKELKKTNLELYVNKSEVWVGESLEVFGRLYAEEALANRSVKVFFDSKEFEVRTNEEGEFSLILVPDFYKEKAKIEAFFPKEGNYSAAKNSSEVVIRFLKPEIKIELNAKNFLPGEIVKVRALTEQRAEIEFLGNRRFSNYAEFEIPLDVSEGEKKVIVRTEANGTIAPGIAYESVYVYRKAVSAEIRVPLFAFSGLGFDVEGEMNESLNGTAVVELGGRVFEGEVRDGKFRLRIEAPFSPSSKDKVRVSFEPDDKRYRAFQKEFEVVLINPIVF
ncbi:MAG: hypothetical protein QXL61_03640, partial [Archaeoglobaceae archaeon]